MQPTLYDRRELHWDHKGLFTKPSQCIESNLKETPGPEATKIKHYGTPLRMGGIQQK